MARSALNRTQAVESDVDAVLDACRLLVAISVQSMASVEDEVDVWQLRILVVLTSRGTASLREVAAATGLHVSTASRACVRMVRLGLIDRREHPDDGRMVQFTPTRSGARLVAQVTAARRTSIKPALERMTRARRAELIATLEEFTAASGRPDETSLWSLGWVT